MIIFLVKSVFPLQPDNNMSLLTLLNNYIGTCCMFKRLLETEKLRTLATLHIYVSVLICSTSLWPPMTIIASSVKLNVKLKRKSFLSAAFFSDGPDGNGRTHKAHRPLRPQLLHRRDRHHFQPFLLECGKTFLYVFFFLPPLCLYVCTNSASIFSTRQVFVKWFFVESYLLNSRSYISDCHPRPQGSQNEPHFCVLYVSLSLQSSPCSPFRYLLLSCCDVFSESWQL